MLIKLSEAIKKWLSLKSLRTRVFFIILIVGIVPVILMRYGILNSYEKRAVESRVTNAQTQLSIIGNHLLSNHYFDGQMTQKNTGASSSQIVTAELEMLSNLYEGRVMIINSALKVVEDTYGISKGKTIISEEVILCFRGQSNYHYDKENGYIEMTTPILDADNSGKIVGVMLTSISNDYIVSTLEVLNRKALLMQNLMIVIIFTLAMVLSIILTKPFNRVTDAINEVKAGYSDELISVQDYVETIHIVDAFNHLLTQMRTLDESRQEFVANVSHELKTPMTSVKVLADSLLAQDNVPTELYREFMEDIVSEIDRENQIITDLLALVKMDKTVQELNISHLCINDLVELILRRLRPLARKKDIAITFESVRTVMAEADEVKLTLIMTNLVENAIKYNVEHGWVKVELDADHQFFTFTVSDSGIGIPEDALPHIYDRFYRVDKSHSREIGGTGLGLAITKNAVLMHRGSITVSSVEGEGSSFVVKIPLSSAGNSLGQNQ